MNDDKSKVIFGGCVVAFFALLFALLFVLPPLGCVGLEGTTYSDGYRVGYVQKFSKKGFVSPSWEGELALPGLIRKGDGVTGVWSFSVEHDKPELIEELSKLDGTELVKLHYRQSLMHNYLRYCTGNRITKIERVKQ